MTYMYNTRDIYYILYLFFKYILFALHIFFAGSVMTGWIPVYDTMHGIRGEVNIIIKVELFSDFNKFRQSSCGVQFFYCKHT